LLKSYVNFIKEERSRVRKITHTRRKTMNGGKRRAGASRVQEQASPFLGTKRKEAQKDEFVGPVSSCKKPGKITRLPEKGRGESAGNIERAVLVAESKGSRRRKGRERTRGSVFREGKEPEEQKGGHQIIGRTER